MTNEEAARIIEIELSNSLRGCDMDLSFALKQAIYALRGYTKQMLLDNQRLIEARSRR